jgi:endonuclease/exonuclease/phosphatase family metal-dependent hydrolase
LIFELFKSETPDILCIQDYYNGPRQRADFADTICRLIGYKYRSIELMNNNNQGFPYGLAIFSKYPLFNPQKIEFPNSKVNFCQSGDVKIGKDTIRIINMHLESIKFGKEDYTFVNEVTNAQAANEKFKKGFLAIVGKMKSAYLKRAPQIDVVAKFVQSSPYPVILTGDFNDTPVSYSYRQIANELDDTFVEAGKGLGQTHSQIISMLRIDYIFHSEKFKTIEHRTIDKDYSDHFPVVARFEFSDEN